MNIKETIAVIEQMRNDGVIGRYAIGGAVAAAFFVEPAETEDVDVFAVLNPLPEQLLVSLESIHSYLEGRGYSVNRNGYSVIAGWQVQFLPADKPLLQEALEQSVVRDVDGTLVPVFTPEYLAAIGLELGRAKDRGRLSQFLEAPAFDRAKFSDILDRHGLLDRWTKYQSQESC